MKTQARVVVIGGGVVGVGTLYHLAKKGWSDVVLIERKELTSGSTWHAAGLLPLFNMSYSVGQIHKFSVNLYKTLEEETGQPVGFKQVSNIRIARTKDRWDEFMYYKGVADTIGVTVNLLTPGHIKELWPLCVTDGLIGGFRHPEDGYIQPADLTQALAKGARARGAEIYRYTTVTAIEHKRNGEWLVKTDRGDIACEHVVSATGNFARRTGVMVGLEVPVMPVEHQYLVTEPHPALLERQRKSLPELGVLRESDSSWYMREENGGFILGPYEVGAPCCYVDGPNDSSEYELFQEDLERLTPHIETAIARVPAFGEVGVKKVYNGAIAYTPDGNPIIGPAWGLKNFWLNEGHSFGVTAAGGAGLQLSEWIVEGEPSIDMMGVDPRRFGPYATSGYLRQKNEEAYTNVFTVHYPDEERAAARPLKCSPCYDRMKALGAVFGSIYGWERPNWFAPEGYGLSKEELAKPDVLLRENHPPVKKGEKPRAWLTYHGSPLTRAISKSMADWIEVSTVALVAVPPWLTIAVLVLIGWRLGGRRVAVLAAAGFAFLWNLRLWEPTMETMVLVTFSTVAALAIGIPMGIACALSRRAWRAVGPCLDMMQTMPSFVYLIPAIPFFGLGSVSAAFATIVFAMPPVIRLTALGIMQVPRELLEAADAFGSTPGQKLFKVQLPLALPTIMAGINQTIMLALSMVVIASMIGAGGLGREVWRSIQRLDAGVGFEAGIAIVIVAVILDRITQKMAQRMRPSGAPAG